MSGFEALRGFRHDRFRACSVVPDSGNEGLSFHAVVEM